MWRSGRQGRILALLLSAPTARRVRRQRRPDGVRYLGKAVERGDFREDLFYRLKVFDIPIPPLRDRIADVLPLSEALLRDIGKSFARPFFAKRLIGAERLG